MTIDMVDNNGKPAKIIKADTSLQKKIGNGPLDERIVTRCQQQQHAAAHLCIGGVLAFDHLLRPR